MAQKYLERAENAQRAAAKSVIRMSMAGANGAAEVVGLEELPGKINYFRGNNPQNWIRDVPTFQRVRYSGVYPGVDLVYYGNGRDLEYDMIVAPGADASQIGFEFQGAQRLEIDPMTAELVVHAPNGAQLRQGRPVIYQEVNGARRPVSGGFSISGSRAGFSLGEYDASRPLVIDPIVRSYSTYLGGEEDDRAHDAAVTADRKAIVVGWTMSEEFPTVNAYQTSISGEEAFVTKFDPEGNELIWSTYIGGTTNPSFDICDILFPICEFGCPPICGDSAVTNGVTGGALNGEGGGPEQSGGNDGAYAVALDADGNVYLTGFTTSLDFPTQNPMQPHIAHADGTFDQDEADGFITKLNAAGNELVFSTYHGGIRGTDVGRGIAVDSTRNVYVVGYTNSFAFPTTNPIQPQIEQGTAKEEDMDRSYDAFISKIHFSGGFRVYSTYLGASDDDLALDVAVDSAGNAHVTGWTDSTGVSGIDPTLPEPPNEIEEFEVPTNNSGPNFITVGPDGQIYFTEQDGNQVGRLNIAVIPTPTFNEFPLPSPSNNRGLTGITANPGGAPSPDPYVYFGESVSQQVGRLEPAGTPPIIAEDGSGTCAVGDMTSSANGRIYYTDPCTTQFGRFDPATNTAAAFSSSCSTLGITSAGGQIFYTTGCGDIVEFDPVTETQTDADVDLITGMNICFGIAIAAGPGGDLFFTGGQCDSRIARFNPTTDVFNYYQIPGNYSAYGITAGPDGHLYFTCRLRTGSAG